MRHRLVSALAATLAALAIAGCGGGGGDSSSDLPSFAPPETQVLIEVTRPQGEAAKEVNSLAQRIAGVSDLGEFIVSKIESRNDEPGRPIDFDKEVEPWLGDRAGIFLQGYDGDEFHAKGVAIETTDVAATEEFIHKRTSGGDEPLENGSYKGVAYEANRAGDHVYGVIGKVFAFAGSKAEFKAMVDASKGESLTEDDAFAEATASAPDGSVADAFVDIGSLVEASGDSIDAETKLGLELFKIEPKDATALLSLLPGSDQVEVDLSSDVISNPPAGDASALLGSLPASSAAAIALPEFGKSFGEGIDRIDRNGIPGQVPAHQFKSLLERVGVDLDNMAASVGAASVFVEGESKADLDGAVVLEATSPKAALNTVAEANLYFHAAGTPGVVDVKDEIVGFAVPDADIGPKPIVVAAKGSRIAVAYGMAAARRALLGSGETFAEGPTYREAVAALGSTPISGFAAGDAALRLASALSDDQDFLDAKPYLSKIDYLAIGSGASGDLATAKLIAGIGK